MLGVWRGIGRLRGRSLFFTWRPPDYRTAIVLRHVQGLSTQQATEIVGVGEAAFKSRQHLDYARTAG